MKKKYWLILIILLVLLIPGLVISPVEVGLIVLKNVLESITLFAEDEDPDEAIKKIYAFVFSVAAVKLSGDLFYYYFGVDLNSLVEDGRLTVKDLDLANTDLRKRVIDLRREHFKELGGAPEFFFENFIRLMSWDDDQVIRQMIIDHQKKEEEMLFEEEEDDLEEETPPSTPSEQISRDIEKAIEREIDEGLLELEKKMEEKQEQEEEEEDEDEDEV